MAMNTNSTVIVGGGFVGLFTALHLRHRNYKDPVILIDSQARFVFKPLLYEYLTGEMQEEQVTPTYTELLQGSNVSFVQDSVTQIDLNQRQVVLLSGAHYSYQYLVLAVGSIQGYFGTDGAQEHAFPFRTQTDALRLKHHLQDCLGQASQTGDRNQRQTLLTFAIVGAGPSGVELAATLADLLPGWYGQRGGNIQDIRIVLINHSENILEGDINTDLRDIALEALKEKKISVELMLGVGVESVEPNQLHYKTKDRTHEISQSLMSATTIWTAGTAPNPLIAALLLPKNCLNKQGQILVTPTLQIPSFPEVFAAGDCVTVQSQFFPPIAQVAYQQGAGIADNLVALSQQKLPKPVPVSLRGTLMKLGIGNGIANLFNKVQIKGKTGDLIRNATYLEMLPSPIHNFKAVTEWLRDDIFEEHTSAKTIASPFDKPKQSSRTVVRLGSIAIAAVLGIGLIAVWRSQTHSPSYTQPHPQQSISLKQI
jgi:NADH dehydrogenase FAD-containing subunit